MDAYTGPPDAHRMTFAELQKCKCGSETWKIHASNNSINITCSQCGVRYMPKPPKKP